MSHTSSGATNLHRTILHDYSKFNFILKQARTETDPWKCGERIIQLLHLESRLLQNLQGPIQLWDRATCREEVSKELSEKIHNITEYQQRLNSEMHVDSGLFPEMQQADPHPFSDTK